MLFNSPTPVPAGPAAYAVELPTPKSPGKSIGQKLYVDFDSHYPAPNAYSVPDTVAVTPGKTFGIKNDIDTGKPLLYPISTDCLLQINIFHPPTLIPFPGRNL